MSAPTRLVADGIENPANARALMDAAGLFGIPCAFRDTQGLATHWSAERGGAALELVDTERLTGEVRPLIAVENAPGATSVYDAPAVNGGSIVVGNERRGVRADLLRASSRCVEIPMPGRRIATLNVACAAAVAMYYLLGGRRDPIRRSRRPEERRPALLLLGPRDHVEAGSAIRSAAAFGWRMVAVDDRHAVWFGVPRSMRAEGRAAARSHRNPVRIVSMTASEDLGFPRVVVVSPTADAPPLRRVDLAGGRSSVIVIPDRDESDWDHLGRRVDVAQVDLPAPAAVVRYRLLASIVLAEAAQQVGVPPVGEPLRRPSRQLTYESALELAAPGAADAVYRDELLHY